MSNDSNDKNKEDESKEKWRTFVRIVITYFAGTFVFIGGGALIILAALGNVNKEAFTQVKDLLVIILPIASGILTHWYTDRSAKKPKPKEE